MPGPRSTSGGSPGLRARRLRSLRYRLRRHAAAYLRLLPALRGAKHVLPDFLIIGGMKCGTTSLFHYLLQHPGIYGSATKEVHFLNNPTYYRFGERWYRGHFPTEKFMRRRSEDLGYPAICGEATPVMLSRFYAINAAAVVPAARLVAVLRNPVDRAYSHYHHTRRSFIGEPRSFYDALQAEAARTARDMALNVTQPGKAGRTHLRFSYAQRGMYIDQIEFWLQHFDREQLKIINYDRLATDPNAACNEICSFLGVPEHVFETSIRRNTGNYTEPMDERSREYLTALFRPYNRRLFEFLGEDWGWPS